MLIDSHCHIYLPDFDEDRQEMISRAEHEGVSRFLMPAIDRETHARMLKLEKQFPGKCIAMMGLHPCSVRENYLEELAIVEQHLQERQFAAVGEIGLDYYWDKTFVVQQADAFEKQIELALRYRLPIVIHSRDSLDECIDMVFKYKPSGLTGVFHCFSGSIEQARKIIELGFYLGIGGVLTFKNSGLDKVVAGLSLDNIILETDAPYLAPVPFRGKRNECSYLRYVVQKMMDMMKVKKEEIHEKTTANAEKLFGL